ncbi:hypothetical protein KEM55_000487 [Ascosphaera atra]|nr:hypothetical protein KEM55_000487 [Ascosphaera atra]
MSSLDTSSEGVSIHRSYTNVLHADIPSTASPTHAIWALFVVSTPLVNAFGGGVSGPKPSTLKVQATGSGELADLVEEFSDGRIQFAFFKVRDPNTQLPKTLLIAWCGDGVPERNKGYFTTHAAAVERVFPVSIPLPSPQSLGLITANPYSPVLQCLPHRPLRRRRQPRRPPPQASRLFRLQVLRLRAGPIRRTWSVFGSLSVVYRLRK